MIWILYTITAMVFQTFRNLEQKSLSKKLDLFTVSWSRFILPLPLSIAAFFYTIETVNSQFIYYCLIGALAQVGGNICLLQTFKEKNFTIGIAFYKTEVIQTLIVGLLFFGATISPVEVAAILVASVGVVLMSDSVFNSGFKKFLQSLRNKTAFYGLLCGFFFSFSAFYIKFASHELSALGYQGIVAPILVLLWVILFQNIFFTGVKIYKKSLKKDLQSLISAENKSTFIKTSILSFAGSVCWFAAYAAGNVIYIKALSQLELIFAIIASYFILKEVPNKVESIGIALTSAGILWLILEQIYKF